jgi:DNA-binding XRE family transcriptional regulator
MSITQSGLPGCRHVRICLGMTQVQLAHAAGLRPQHLNSIECLRRDCSLSTMRRIAKALGCDVSDLVGEPSPLRLSEIRLMHAQRAAHEQAHRAMITGGTNG